MKLVVSRGFPFENEEGYIHAQEQDGVLFVSKELLQTVKEYLLEKDIVNSERFAVLHHNHTADYSSNDSEGKK